MQRVLDLDLDFFIEGVAHWRDQGRERLDGDEFPPWPAEEVITFLEERCGLTGTIPGVAVEGHGELFGRWRELIESGLLTTPFEVVHVDAHADLGLGDNGYNYLITNLLYEPPERRWHPEEDYDRMNDGNYLAFAIACRWIASLTYVFSPGGGNDALVYFLDGFNPNAENIRLPAMSPGQLDRLMHRRGEPEVDRFEPRVPFREMPWREFHDRGGFDLVCLARSPAYTPAQADPLYELIQERFIDEAALH